MSISTRVLCITTRAEYAGPMRTTVTIEDALYRRTKAAAGRSGRTVSQVIEDALRQALEQRPPTPADLEPLPTFGGSGVMPGVDLSSNASIAEAMEGCDLDALR